MKRRALLKRGGAVAGAAGVLGILYQQSTNSGPQPFRRWIPAFEQYRPENEGIALAYTSLADIRRYDAMTPEARQRAERPARLFGQYPGVTPADINWVLGFSGHIVAAGNIPKANAADYYSNTSLRRIEDIGPYTIWAGNSDRYAVAVKNDRAVALTPSDYSWERNPAQRVREIIQAATGQEPGAASEIGPFDRAAQGHGAPHLFSLVLGPASGDYTTQERPEGTIAQSGSWRFTPSAADLKFRLVHEGDLSTDTVREWTETEAFDHYDISSVRADGGTIKIEATGDPQQVDGLRPG